MDIRLFALVTDKKRNKQTREGERKQFLNYNHRFYLPSNRKTKVSGNPIPSTDVR